MTDKIGKKRFNRIGRSGVGRTSLMGAKFQGERQNQERAHKDAQEWRDRARESILRSRDRLKVILSRNEAKTKKKLENRRKNINPSFFPLIRRFNRRDRPTFTHSTVPAKPKYSLIKPKERLYGMKLKKTEAPKRKMHPAIEKAVEEIRADIKKETTVEEIRVDAEKEEAK